MFDFSKFTVDVQENIFALKRCFIGISKIDFSIWLGQGTTPRSFPEKNDLDINQYKFITVTLRKSPGGFNSLPSEIHSTLRKYNIFSSDDGSCILLISPSEAEKLYIDICHIYCVEPIASQTKYYCNDCGGEMYYKSELCWACEKGI